MSDADTSDCPFCAYVGGASAPPSGGVRFSFYRDEQPVAFAPLSPAAAGHVMVVSARHVASLAELSPAEAFAVMEGVGNEYAAAVDRLAPDGMNVVIQAGEAGGQSVEHLHVHVVPRWDDDGLGFRWTPDSSPTPTPEEDTP